MDSNSKPSPPLPPVDAPQLEPAPPPMDALPPPPPPPMAAPPAIAPPSEAPAEAAAIASPPAPPATQASPPAPPVPQVIEQQPSLAQAPVSSPLQAPITTGLSSNQVSQPPQQSFQQPPPAMQPLQLPPQSTVDSGTSMMLQASQLPQQDSQAPPPQPSPPGGGGSESGRVLRVEDALTYLDEVKRQFGDQPQIYNMFLEIMKSFKAETIDTPGVIQKVSELFRGHPNLILGFNTFLPPGFRIESSDIMHDEAQHAAAMQGFAGVPTNPLLHHQMLQQQLGQQMMHQGQPSVMLGPGGAAQMMIDNPAFYLNPHTAYFEHQPHQYMMMMAAGNEALQQQQLQAQQQGQPGQPVEFDHAISYVTRIKRRFANDPETYKAFLDILHTYQKEQKSIKEVLDQVSDLFKEHSDLLKEFTYFLPDGVREKAKQEINKINNRRKKEEQRKQEKKEQQKPGPKPGKLDKPAAMTLGSQLMPGAGMKANSPTSGAARRDKEQREGFSQQDELEEAAERERGGDRGINITLGKVPRLEKRLFARIKAALNNRERWGEFLKCLELFSQEVISRQELIALCTDLFANSTELLEEFDRLLASRGATDDNTEDAWFSLPLSDIDFSQSRRCTPSYRSLPPNYPKPPCSERTALCRMVLNDTWVSVPTGSEDFSFKGMRKNQYEEALFKCEDDRYELDMVIDANISTVYALELLIAEIDALQNANANSNSKGDVAMSESGAPVAPAAVAARFKLDRRTLSVIHLKAIARVYGDRATEIFELLRKSPASAIPVILTRLKAKDEEWRRLRSKMNEVWKEVQEKNYIKSLDHRSFYFKQNEKKLLTTKTMLSEAKVGEKTSVTLEFPDAFAHRHANTLISLCLEKTLNKLDYDKCVSAMEKIVSRLVGVKSFGGKPITTTKVGTKVLSRYGLGTITASSAANSPTCEVRLVASGTVIKVPKEDLLEAAPFNPKEMSVTGPSSSTSNEVVHVGQSGYLFLRFYNILCDRIARAEALCSTLEREQRTQVKHVMDRNGGNNSGGSSSTTTADLAAVVAAGTTNAPEEPTSPSMTTEGEKTSLFSRLMELVKQFVRGTLDSNRFEDEVYTTVGPNCYFMFTIDKVLNHVVKASQGMVNEDRAARVVDAVAKYAEKKTASFAADMYRACSDALSLSNACAAARVRVVAGTNPLSPPAKKLADSASDTASSVSATAQLTGLASVTAAANAVAPPADLILTPVDSLWETPPHVVVEFLESIPQNVNFGAAGNRSLSPVFDADGSIITTEMGELELALPVKLDLSKKMVANPLTDAESVATPGGRKKASVAIAEPIPTASASAASATTVGTTNGGPEWVVLSIFMMERIPGSDDVLRRVSNFKGDSGSDKDWWKASNSATERSLSPAPEDSSSNEDGPVGGAKRIRTEENAD